MTVDIIILSHAKSLALKQLTQQTINSCHKSESDIKFNVLVIEQASGVVYENAATHFLSEEFNYNRFMNIGIEATHSEYVCLCNNDLLFNRGWVTNIISAMKQFNLLSACPRCPDSTYKGVSSVDFGYNNRHHMSGWCIMTARKLFETIGKIDEDFPFWFADNAYAEQLKKHEIKHALVRSSIVRHLGSRTLSTLNPNEYNEMTRALIKKFVAKYPDNESAKFFAKQL